MKIIAFLGSPRKNGNSALLLREAVKGIEETGLKVHIFNLNEMDISPCQSCGGCEDTGVCVFHDDMTQINASIREASRIILASPIYFFGVSAQVKIMIDRCQCFWCEKYLLKKPIQEGSYGRKGLLLLVGGQKKEIGIQCAEATAKAFFRTVSVPEHETLGYLSVDAQGTIVNHPTALSDAYRAGKKLVSFNKGGG
jgi:multimeric flavodoxin WrbA